MTPSGAGPKESEREMQYLGAEVEVATVLQRRFIQEEG